MVSKKKYLLLIIFRALGLFLNIAAFLVTARYFGASQDRDFFVLAMSITTILPMMTYGSLNEIFRTKFVHIRETQGLEKAITSAKSVIICVTIISLAIILLGTLNVEAIARFFSGGREVSSLPLLVTLIKMTLPIILFSQLSVFWIQALNCFKIYFIPEIFGLLSSAINIILVILLFDKMGVFSLVVSSYTSAILLTVILAFIIRKNISGMLNLRLVDFSGIKPYFMAALPLMFVYWIGQISVVFEKRLSMGFGIGNIAILDYAAKVMSVPQGVIFSVVATMLAPALAKHYANKNTFGFSNELWSFYRFAFLIFAPCIFCMSFLSTEIGNILFASKITAEEINTFGTVVMIYGFGLIGVMHHVIFTQTLIAQSKGYTVFIIASLCQIMILACNLTFAYKWGISGLAASWSIWHIVSGFALMLFSRVFGRQQLILILRLCGFYIFSFSLAMGINLLLPELSPILQIAANLFIFLSVMYAMMLVLKFEEVKKIHQYLTHFKKESNDAKN